MNKKAQRIVRDIKMLRIQGARNIAKAAVDALASESDSFTGNSRDAYLSALLVTADALAAARPTEPMLRNYLRYVINYVQRDKDAPVSELKQLVSSLQKGIYKDMERSKAEIVKYGAALISNGSTYLTHCHSSTVVGIFTKAYDEGKDFAVIACETRPLYQGVKTARELAAYGIPTTLIVDSAAYSHIRHCHAVFVGADAVMASGNLINKVGTAGIAHFAHSFEIPFYSAAELHKFDHLTRWGMPVPIEQRSPDEVLRESHKTKNLSIANPAFDVTPADHVTAYITEKGIIPPQSIMFLV